ncbi:MAG: serine/threonine-protein phosphatase, partial [bacterium]|nr:serine/threonine-protein phosphatase [bacterium]
MKTATEVGGDYYDFRVQEDGSLVVVISDATGHGLKAGTMVSITKSLFLADDSGSAFKHFFSKCNQTIKKMRLGNLFMALMAVHIDGNEVLVASAGMPPLFVVRNKESGQEECTVEEVIIKTPALGAFQKLLCRSREIELRKGDVLLLSDGLPEAFSPGGEMFGYTRLSKLLTRVGDVSPAGIIEQLVTA